AAQGKGRPGLGEDLAPHPVQAQGSPQPDPPAVRGHPEQPPAPAARGGRQGAGGRGEGRRGPVQAPWSAKGGGGRGPPPGGAPPPGGGKPRRRDEPKGP